MATPKPPKTPTGRGGASGGATDGATGGGATSNVEVVENVPSTTVKVKRDKTWRMSAYVLGNQFTYVVK